MAKRLQYDDVKKYVESKKCKLLSNKYINNTTKMLFRCKCGEIFKTTFQIFKANKKHQCKDCGIEIKRQRFLKTNKQFKEDIKKIDNNFDILEEYKGAHVKIKFIYKPTGKIVEMTPDSFLTGKTRGFCWRTTLFTS